LSRSDSEESELTYDFVQPPAWRTGIQLRQQRHSELQHAECELDEQVMASYGLTGDAREAIESELRDVQKVSSPDDDDDAQVDEDRDEADENADMSCDQLAARWIGYALGIVTGRFRPGVEGGLGRGDFAADVAKQLCGMADADGILVQDEGHPDDLAARTLAALRIMLGDEAAREVVLTAADRTGETEPVLRKYLEGPFFKEHIKLYRKRPVYWLLQSPKKKYGVWIFHEQLTSDSLYRIQREYVDLKMKLLEGQLGEFRKKQDAAEGRERRQAEKEMAPIEDVLADVREFAARINEVIQRGYRPHIDDGVLLNMAPLWGLIPSWQAEPKKAWKAPSNRATMTGRSTPWTTGPTG